MARRKVIADSEDEDEGDDIEMCGAEGDICPPEPEPLSPHHRPSSPAAAESLREESDVTDPSFFARLYNDHQSLAAQQSNLIENIVRQSQRASASSGDVSFPTKSKGRNANPSSGTNVTSPLALNRSQVHKKLFGDGASEFTTPHRSVAQEWEVPSSPEGETVSHATKDTRGKPKTYGRTRRRESKQPSSPAAAKITAARETAHNADFEESDVNHQLPEDQYIELPPPPTVRARKISQHHTAVSDTANFYIVQSNLTTMQKLEYQKVNTSTNGYGGLPGSLVHHKSSGATTIAYSTPSGYSSIPPLPGEESLAPGMEHGSPRRNEIIRISSSPDHFASAYGISDEQGPTGEADIEVDIETPPLDESGKYPKADYTSAPIRKEKRKAIEMGDEDELNRDPPCDPEDVDMLQESYKPRPTKRRSAAAGCPDIEASTDSLETVREEKAAVQAEVPSANPVPDLLDTGQVEPQPEAVPKKRGRKKKQPVTELPPEEEKEKEGSVLVDDPIPSEKEAEREPAIEKRKKKRGRPRKAEAHKVIEKPLPDAHESSVEDELPKTNSPLRSNDRSESALISKKEDGCEQMTNDKEREASADVEGAESKESRQALKEKDKNPKSPTKRGSNEGPATETEPETKDDKSAQKPAQPKATPKSAATPSKITYRVGLSKRSRIAPLLKSIKK